MKELAVQLDLEDLAQLKNGDALVIPIDHDQHAILYPPGDHDSESSE